MFPRRLLIAAGVATFLLGLLALFPARLAIAWFAPEDFGASGVEGTLWRGAASEVSAAGVYLAPVSWRFRPFAILRGSVGYDVDARLPAGSVNGAVAMTLTGALVVSDLEATVALSTISALMPVAQAEGRLRADLDSGRFRNGWPLELIGVVTVEDLVYRPAGSNSIGNYRAEFVAVDDDGVRGILADGGGPLEVVGEITMTPARNYELRGQVKARPGASAALTNSLRFLGSANESGMREFSLAGQL